VTTGTTGTTGTAGTAGEREVELHIGGMTCAACAARVGKRLSRLDGVLNSLRLRRFGR
jgi:Cu+-exporting ATPase